MEELLLEELEVFKVRTSLLYHCTFASYRYNYFLQITYNLLILGEKNEILYEPYSKQTWAESPKYLLNSFPRINELMGIQYI